MATCQMVRFSSTIFAQLLQTILLNGPETNAPGCKIGLEYCWTFGFSGKQIKYSF